MAPISPKYEGLCRTTGVNGGTPPFSWPRAVICDSTAVRALRALRCVFIPCNITEACMKK